MRKLMGLFGFVLLVGFPALAQDSSPRLEVFGGYSYLSFDAPGGPRLNMNGWNASANLNINGWFGAVADFSGVYNDRGVNGTTHIYTALFGPRVYPLGHHRVTPYGQAIFGFGHITLNVPASGNLPAFTIKDQDFSWGAGGGLDVSLSRNISWRLGEFNYVWTPFFGGNPNQNNFRFSTGIVLRFGGR